MMDGETPAVILTNPKFPHNVGAVLRACAALGAKQLYVTGNRAQWEVTGKGQRLPREERMKQYKDEVTLIRSDRPFDHFTDAAPIAIEVDPTAEPLATFELSHLDDNGQPVYLHPENAVY